MLRSLYKLGGRVEPLGSSLLSNQMRLISLGVLGASQTYLPSSLYCKTQRKSKYCYHHPNCTSALCSSTMQTHASSSSFSSLYSAKRTFMQSHLQRIRVKDRSFGSSDSYVRPVTSPMHYGENEYNRSGSGGGSQMDSLTPYVRAHLGRVYSLLGAGVGVAGLGSFLMACTPLGAAIPFWLPMVGGFVPLLWLSFAPPADPVAKMSLFFAFTLLEGMAIAPLVLMTSMKGVLVTSLVLTAAVFGGFSAAAYLSPRASLVAWQGPLFGALIGLVAISLLNIFFPSTIAHSLILYGGLALFSAMVAVDTQAMIERARCGAGDYVQDAMQMFLNVINIFVRIAQIMSSMDREGK